MFVSVSLFPFRCDEIIRREAERTEEEKLVKDSATGMSISEKM